jgi:ferrous iron transport protein A
MKTILDCELGQMYTVKKLHTNGALRQRLISFGIRKGVLIKYLNATNFKGTYEVQVGKMNIALRKEEVIKIEVE